MNPILQRSPGATEYILFGEPEVNWSYQLDDTQEDWGRANGYWAVWADYATDLRCSFTGDCRCKTFFGWGCDSEAEAGALKARLIREAVAIR